MHTLIQSFLDNDSRFGRLMTRAGIIIGSNLMFVLFSLPGITMGAAFVALYHVMLKTLRGNGLVNPLKEFWRGFLLNFKQATVCWLGFLILGILAYLDLNICRQAGGFFSYLQYGIYALTIAALILGCYLLPVMAAFEDTIPHFIRNAFFFAAKNPWKLIVMLFVHVFPLILTYSDLKNMPLYAFLWCFFGFGAVAMAGSSMMLSEFVPYLDHEQADVEELDTDEQMMEDMMKLDGM